MCVCVLVCVCVFVCVCVCVRAHVYVHTIVPFSATIMQLRWKWVQDGCKRCVMATNCALSCKVSCICNMGMHECI